MPYIGEDKRWRAREDAYSLAQAEEVKADPARLEAARKEAQKMVEEEQERLKGMRKAAGQKVSLSKPSSNAASPMHSVKSPPNGPNDFNVFKKI